MAIHIKRMYEPASPADGHRILVDRLWPRGTTKQDAQLDVWLKDVAPSTELRKWFNHEPAKWEGFVTRYRAELQGSAAWAELQKLVHAHKTVTLLFAAKDGQHNQAVALRQMLQS